MWGRIRWQIVACGKCDRHKCENWNRKFCSPTNCCGVNEWMADDNNGDTKTIYSIQTFFSRFIRWFCNRIVDKVRLVYHARNQTIDNELHVSVMVALNSFLIWFSQVLFHFVNSQNLNKIDSFSETSMSTVIKMWNIFIWFYFTFSSVQNVVNFSDVNIIR